MDWIFNLYETNPTAQAIAIISLVCVVGMALGSVKVRGIGLGTASVLFAGIVIGRFSKPVDHHTLEFIKEFGLVLFVFCIGLQLGPGFFSSLRQTGLRMNAMAATVVVMGAALAAGLGWVMGLDPAASLGVFSGATTNTPSLGAAQQTLSELPGVSAERAALPALAYAVTYPAAVLGIICTLLVLRTVFRIDPRRDAEAFAATQRGSVEPLARRTLVVDNPNLDGLPIDEVPGAAETGVVVSRIRRSGEAQVAAAIGGTVLHTGDAILAVGTERHLDQYQRVVGHAGGEDLMAAPGSVTYRRVVVTNKAVLGRPVRRLTLESLPGVTVTRVERAGMEMTATADVHLKFGDVLRLVGDEASVAHAASLLGDSLKALSETHFLPLFAGIVLGIALGTLPLAVPGLPQPLRLGLAGGPLIVALLLGRIGRIGPVIWHMPLNANLAFREFGIALFFAAVGLMAGPSFFEVVFSTRGLRWLAAGVCVTLAPILAVGVFALAVWRMNFMLVSGMIAGSMTDPPALAFANNVCGSESPTIAYAAVYPLTTVLRIMSAQVLAVLLCG